MLGMKPSSTAHRKNAIHTLSPVLPAHPVHAVVPVAGAEQRQPVRAGRE
jgi:hypothetical protein